MKKSALDLSGEEFFPIRDFHLAVVPVHHNEDRHDWNNYTYINHYHNFSEMVMITSGSAIQNINGVDYPVECGDLFLLEGNTTHYFHKGSAFSLMNLLVDRNTLPVPWEQFQRKKGYNMFFFVEPKTRNPQTFRNRLRISGERLILLKNQWLELYELLWNDQNSYRMFDAVARLIQIIVNVSRFCEEQNVSNPNILPKISEVLALLEKNYQENYTLDKLAGMACTSPRNFTRQFRNVTGDSPIGFLLRLRLRHAENMLKDKTLRIVEIAQHCGFSDSNYFTKFFTKNYGISPREYRNRKNFLVKSM